MSAKPNNRSLSAPAVRALKKLGTDLALARRRRHITQVSMAERLGISVATLRRLEKGDPRISMGTLAQSLLILGELEKINGLLDTATDDIGLMMMNDALPQRVRTKRLTSGSGGL
ncbi:helix-turn-helix domain-containing protein [Symbiopectobacterium purcellii]|uniref:helix-turn-helix domain-containing protein n=1 Tax=Symbiopectobacterium purcellii TaxID=2871826 RepID=UPI003F863112